VVARTVCGVMLSAALAIVMLCVPALAGSNAVCKIAVHVKSHPTSCTKNYPVFWNCLDISTTYPALGEIDIIPVVYDLSQYTAVEFSLELDGSLTMTSWSRCKGDGQIGQDPTTGVSIYWLTCQHGWSVAPGYVWCSVNGPSQVRPLPNPATGRIGAFDCAGSPGPYYDYVIYAASAGIGGPLGEDPCPGDAVDQSTWGTIKALFE